MNRINSKQTVTGTEVQQKTSQIQTREAPRPCHVPLRQIVFTDTNVEVFWQNNGVPFESTLQYPHRGLLKSSLVIVVE